MASLSSRLAWLLTFFLSSESPLAFVDAPTVPPDIHTMYVLDAVKLRHALPALDPGATLVSVIGDCYAAEPVVADLLSRRPDGTEVVLYVGRAPSGLGDRLHQRGYAFREVSVRIARHRFGVVGVPLQVRPDDLAVGRWGCLL